jgi:hypothetical protein
LIDAFYDQCLQVSTPNIHRLIVNGSEAKLLTDAELVVEREVRRAALSKQLEEADAIELSPESVAAPTVSEVPEELPEEGGEEGRADLVQRANLLYRSKRIDETIATHDDLEVHKSTCITHSSTHYSTAPVVLHCHTLTVTHSLSHTHCHLTRKRRKNKGG